MGNRHEATAIPPKATVRDYDLGVRVVLAAGSARIATVDDRNRDDLGSDDRNRSDITRKRCSGLNSCGLDRCSSSRRRYARTVLSPLVDRLKGVEH